MVSYFYILHSATSDKYYIGSTGDTLASRLSKHNMHHKGFTGQAHDWVVVYFESYEIRSDAYSREREVKSWKSRRRIERLIKGAIPD